MAESATAQAATAGVEAPAGAARDAAEAETAGATVAEDSPETAGPGVPGGTAKEPVAADDDDGADGVGIPRQQSPEETADSEAADEGART
ncbi:hypothetical protein [Streptomyces hilarionis]|uniref:hypothetical protein n=1 Tax=Streptomyces hilarionis TaxID=2839954 RepID=UPI002119E9F5|nr:hypothetical protein [Streptomyces hilarionis]